jgi:uncharacterized membrane protein YqjE
MDKADKNILTADEINFMLQDESKYKSIPTIKLFGISVGLESLIITIISIIVWIIIWKIFGLFKLGKFTIILFILYIIIAFFNIFNSSTDTEISVENAVYELQNQISRIEGALGSIVLVFVFLYNMKLDEAHRLFAYKLLIIIISMLILSIVTLDPKNDTRNIRNIRLFIQKLYNQAVILFILCLLVIYFGITKI